MSHFILVNNSEGSFQTFDSRAEAGKAAAAILQSDPDTDLKLSAWAPQTVSVRPQIVLGDEAVPLDSMSEGRKDGRGRPKGSVAPRDAEGRPLKKNGEPYKTYTRKGDGSVEGSDAGETSAAA